MPIIIRNNENNKLYLKHNNEKINLSCETFVKELREWFNAKKLQSKEKNELKICNYKLLLPLDLLPCLLRFISLYFKNKFNACY